MKRPLLKGIERADDDEIERRLRDEEDRERAADRAYWAPLRRELEMFRHQAARRKKTIS